MGRERRNSRSQFQYWDMHRRGISQSEISDISNISRQAVSKAIKNFEINVTARLLSTSESSGILIDWYDQGKGILIGTIPPLGNVICIVIVDQYDQLRIHYDPDAIAEKRLRKSAWIKLSRDVLYVFGNRIGNIKDIIEMIEKITENKREEKK
jgi:hypothetical protein